MTPFESLTIQFVLESSENYVISDDMVKRMNSLYRPIATLGLVLAVMSIFQNVIVAIVTITIAMTWLLATRALLSFFARLREKCDSNAASDIAENNNTISKYNQVLDVISKLQLNVSSET